MSVSNVVRVWDPFVRFFHWALSGSVAVAWLSGGEFMSLHEWIGYSITGLLVLRLVWGFSSSGYARFADFVRSPREVLDYLREVRVSRAKRYLGHNPAGGAMIVALLLALFGTVLTGMAAYGSGEALGPLSAMFAWTGEREAHWIKEIHEVFADGVLVLVFLHVSGVFLASYQHHENLPQAMWTGFKKKEV